MTRSPAPPISLRRARTRGRSPVQQTQQLFGYSRTKATTLMLRVHNEGKAVVSSGKQEKAELDVSRLHAQGFWATMQQD